MSPTPEPNRIHTLPVRINYHLPGTSSAFTTTLPTPQQVYVYPNASASSGDAEVESWGSIYLKTVIQGLVMASPEILPGTSTRSPDLSLYILDPRETFLRRSRAASSPYPARPSGGPLASSPALNTSSPAPGPSSYPTNTEVWTGKGLVSWALDEPGLGKNLITGRLVYSSEFSQVTQDKDSQGAEISPLEALMAASAGYGGEGGGDESWGIEVSLGLKSGIGGAIGLHPQLQHVMSTSGEPLGRSSSSSSEIKIERDSSPGPSHFHHAHHPAVPSRNGHANVENPYSRGSPYIPSASASISKGVAATPSAGVKRPDGKGAKGHSGGRRKKASPPSRHLANIDVNARRAPTARSHQVQVPSLPEIPAEVYANPQTLTKEQAQRLIASPFFLDLMGELTGAPVQPRKRGAGAESIWNTSSSSAALTGSLLSKSAKLAAEHQHAHAHAHAHTGGRAAEGKSESDGEDTKCYNCGRTKSAVWRQKVMEDGKTVRVCNACGLYWNKLGSMRPPTLWEGVDDDVKSKDRAVRTPAAVPPSSEADVPAPRMDSGFKRTLSAAAEKDARRIASLRKPSLPRSSLHHQVIKGAPMTSPPRSSMSVTKTVRNVSRIVDSQPAASSPGGYAHALHSDSQPHPAQQNRRDSAPILVPGQIPSSPPRTRASESLSHGHGHGVQESPNTAIRRILGTDLPLNSLDLPLSDDGKGGGGGGGGGGDWTTDISSFFDMEGFELSTGPNAGVSARSPPPQAFHRSSSSHGSSARRRQRLDNTSHQHQHGYQSSEGNEDDDALSQLFNRTSSMGAPSSPIPFDFSQLPPSSPPAEPPAPTHSHSHSHSNLLLSSPDESPMSFSPVPVPIPMDIKTTSAAVLAPGPGHGRLISPEKKSKLQQSFTAVNPQGHPVDVGTPAPAPAPAPALAAGGDASDADADFEEIKRLLENATPETISALWSQISPHPNLALDPTTSTGATSTDLAAEDEFMAFFNTYVE